MNTAPPGHDPMMRWLPVPRPVLVNPQAVLVLPRRWPRASERPLGVMAGAIDLRLDQQWIPATLYRWLRVHLNFWICEIEVSYSSKEAELHSMQYSAGWCNHGSAWWRPSNRVGGQLRRWG